MYRLKMEKLLPFKRKQWLLNTPSVMSIFYMSRKFSEDVEKGSMSILLFMLMEELKD